MADSVSQNYASRSFIRFDTPFSCSLFSISFGSILLKLEGDGLDRRTQKRAQRLERA